MNKCLLRALAIGLLIAAHGCSGKVEDKKTEKVEDKKPEDAKEKLQGTWNAVSSVMDGKNDPESEFKGESFTFEGDKCILKKRKGNWIGSYKVDASQKPAQLDITLDNGEMVKLIYQLDGDTLNLGEKNGGTRPKSFEAATDTRQLTLKREKK